MPGGVDTLPEMGFDERKPSMPMDLSRRFLNNNED
jgi:hypothetical protein